MLRRRAIESCALSADPDNVDALVESARAAALLFVTDPAATLFAAEAKLTKALSSTTGRRSAPDTPRSSDPPRSAHPTGYAAQRSNLGS
jgi:hypothetical protein